MEFGLSSFLGTRAVTGAKLKDSDHPVQMLPFLIILDESGCRNDTGGGHINISQNEHS